MRVDLKALTVLLIDDERSLTKLLNMMLTEMGVTNVVSAPGASKAVQRLTNADERYDLLVADLSDKRPRGWALLAKIGQIAPSTTVVALVNSSKSASICESIAKCGAIVVLKPFVYAEFENAIRNAATLNFAKAMMNEMSERGRSMA